MDERTDEQLKSALASGELSPRKEAVAKEVLRRRSDAKERGVIWKYLWAPVKALLELAANVRLGSSKRTA
jgi:hypothetical protein